MNNKTNILSYFIKDIKDPIKCAMYKQNNYEELITICYKNEVIFIINIENICNFINNIYKSRSINNNKCNYKIGSSIKFKQLFYKHDKNIKCSNRNYITFNYVIYKKYTIKTYFNYINNNILLFSIEVKYYNGYKYIIKPYKRKKKYTNNIILIMNKYELYYYNTFFNFYL